MADKLRKKCGEILRAGVMLLLFVTPVIFSEMLFDRYSMLRITLLRILAPVIFLVWLIRKIRQKAEFKVSVITLITSMFVVLAGIMTVVSAEPYMSFWGLYKFYSWGFSTILLCYMIFIVVSDEFDLEDQNPYRTRHP